MWAKFLRKAVIKYKYLNILLAIFLSGLTGCVYDIGKLNNGDPLSFYDSPNDDNPNDVKNPNRVDSNNITGIQNNKYENPSLYKPKSRELADALLNQSDINCQNYLTGVSWINNTTSFGLDFLALTLSAISPITIPSRSAGILSAGSAVATGAKTKLSSDVLGGKDYGLIHDAIIDGRLAERKIIQADIDTGKFDGWTKYAILSHMQPYHYNCGLEYGLKYLRESLAAKASPAPDASTVAAATDAAIAAKAKAVTAHQASMDAEAKVEQLKVVEAADAAAVKTAVPGSPDFAQKADADKKSQASVQDAEINAQALADADILAHAAQITAKAKADAAKGDAADKGSAAAPTPTG